MKKSRIIVLSILFLLTTLMTSLSLAYWLGDVRTPDSETALVPIEIGSWEDSFTIMDGAINFEDLKWQGGAYYFQLNGKKLELEDINPAVIYHPSIKTYLVLNTEDLKKPNVELDNPNRSYIHSEINYTPYVKYRKNDLVFFEGLFYQVTNAEKANDLGIKPSENSGWEIFENYFNPETNNYKENELVIHNGIAYVYTSDRGKQHLCEPNTINNNWTQVEDYIENISYQKEDLVRSDGLYYQAKKNLAATDNTLENFSKNWEKLAEKDFNERYKGIYTSGKNYREQDIVEHQGVIYLAKKADIRPCEPASLNSHWNLYKQLDYISTNLYQENDIVRFENKFYRAMKDDIMGINPSLNNSKYWVLANQIQ